MKLEIQEIYLWSQEELLIKRIRVSETSKPAQ